MAGTLYFMQIKTDKNAPIKTVAVSIQSLSH